MKWLKTISTECFALFIDDGPFAAAILLWLLLVGTLLPHLSIPKFWHPPLLLVGLLAILFESVLRRARRRR
jgi:hypothetical protein